MKMRLALRECVAYRTFSRQRQVGPRALASKNESHSLLIVESPTKANTIGQFLGDDWHVMSSNGHVRDLMPKQDGVDPDNEFALKWQVKRNAPLNDIVGAAKKANRLVLATDCDREGEAIAWHIQELLYEQNAIPRGLQIERSSFTEVTERSVKEAIEQPMGISQTLVEAYLARRSLDHLVGFTLSPLLWRKLPLAKSAGRVQSSTLRILCEKEDDIDDFKPTEYWSVSASIDARGRSIVASLISIDGEKLGDLPFTKVEEAEWACELIRGADLKVDSVETRDINIKPKAPFTTSTLQQEAWKRLGFSGSRAMRAAQKLYEKGEITYMRTDSVAMNESSLTSLAQAASKFYSNQLKQHRKYATHSGNAHEAHEAIRPTKPENHKPSNSKASDESALYSLIWQRAVASQMVDSVQQRTRVDVSNAEKQGEASSAFTLRATESTIKFAGWQLAYGVGKDEAGSNLLGLQKGDSVTLERASSKGHETKPPSRFNEGSLVGRLESEGIGRPSTYAPTIQLLRERGYIRRERKEIVPTGRGRVLIAFLKHYFKETVTDVDFTRSMEGKLDGVAKGEVEWKKVMSAFWSRFEPQIANVNQNVTTEEIVGMMNDGFGEKLFEQRNQGSDCPNCDGSLRLKLSRTGAFIGCSNYPKCTFAEPAFECGGQHRGNQPTTSTVRLLGICPDTKRPVTVRNGSYAPYVELGEREGGQDEEEERTTTRSQKAANGYMLFCERERERVRKEVGEKEAKEVARELGRRWRNADDETRRKYKERAKQGAGRKKEKPKKEKLKRVSLPSGIDSEAVSLELALSLLSLPKRVGWREKGRGVYVTRGPYGWYVFDDEMRASVPASELPSDGSIPVIGAERADELLAQRGKRPSRDRGGAGKGGRGRRKKHGR